MARWTDFVIAHRGRIIAVWLVLFLLGGYAAGNLGGLLSNRFSVPGADSYLVLRDGKETGDPFRLQGSQKEWTDKGD